MRILATLTALLLMCINPVWSATSDTGPDARWNLIRSQLFSDRDIHEGQGVIALEAPGRALDAARVAVTLRALAPQSEQQYIKTLWLIVDKNPLPVAGTFHFEPNHGWDTIDTELRVNEYSSIRTVAETSDGVLHMDSSFIKASGGCSAPPSSFERSNAVMLGSFNGGIDQFLDPRVPAVARIRLIHPNASGMQFDQMSRTYIPAEYIHTMGVELDGETLFTLDTNFSLSQDPILGFNFQPKADGELLIYALDSEDRQFRKTWQVEAGGAN